MRAPNCFPSGYVISRPESSKFAKCRPSAKSLAVARRPLLGVKQTSRPEISMSALPPKADIASGQSDVRFVPKADIDRTQPGGESADVEFEQDLSVATRLQGTIDRLLELVEGIHLLDGRGQ
jgi:hypothetical protein